jgi:hypothetical protein
VLGNNQFNLKATTITVLIHKHVHIILIKILDKFKDKYICKESNIVLVNIKMHIDNNNKNGQPT